MKDAKMELKRMAKAVLKRIGKYWPQSPERLTGKLAVHGGKPIRNLRLRPWPGFPRNTYREWIFSLGPTLRRLFLSGEEGLPCTLSKEFERQWASYCHTRFGLLLPHGTDALRIGLAAAVDHDGMEYGGEVIVPNITFIASANAALDRRFGVVLVDVDKSTLNIDPNRVEEAIIKGKTKAIMAVHLFGQPADISALRNLANLYGLALIEDAAQGHGAIHELGPAGSLGDVAGFSFQRFKNLPSGEGGALTTNDEDIFERAYRIYNVGRPSSGGLRWGHQTLGWNCRPVEYTAAVLLHRLKLLEMQQLLRWQHFQFLQHALSEIPCIEPLGMGPGVVRHAAHMFVMRYYPKHCGGLQVDDFIHSMNREGIPLARAYTLTLAQQQSIQDLAKQRAAYVRLTDTPVADQAVKELIYLPHDVLLATKDEVQEIAASFSKVYQHYATTTLGIMKFSSLLPSNDATSYTPEKSLKVKAERSTKLKIRVGVVGVGAMGQHHARVISGCPQYSLEAVADSNIELARGLAAELNCRCAEKPHDMIAPDMFDVIIIATPHWQHPNMAVQAFESGLEVICEKPLAVTLKDAEIVMRAAKLANRLFAVVHQTRFDPAYQYVKQLLLSGEMGDIIRCAMTECAWRSNAYYQSSSWRGTWKGEGGGVLLNQAPHLLDRYAWLCGMPEAVIGFCDTTLHQIEVEDSVSAVLRHMNGTHGSIHVSTNESPPVAQTVISCDRGRIVVEQGQVTVSRLTDSIKQRTKHDQQFMGSIDFETRTWEFPILNVIDDLLKLFYEDFAAAHWGEKELICPGVQGINAVELANAIVLSSHSHTEVKLPLNPQVYSTFIAGKL